MPIEREAIRGACQMIMRAPETEKILILGPSGIRRHDVGVGNTNSVGGIYTA
jgi:hypothetical protein